MLILLKYQNTILEKIANYSSQHKFHTMSQNKITDSPFNQLLAGSFAGLVSDGCVHPIDTIRTRLQTQSALNKSYRGTFHVIQDIMKNEGIRAFYKGFGVVALGTFPAHGLYFLAYESTKKLIGKENEFVWLVAGLTADVSGALIWTPMDIIKQRMQLQKYNTNQTDGANKPNSLSIVKEIIKTNGFKGMFRGMGAGIATFAPFVMIYFSLYERLKILAATKYYADGRSPLELPIHTCLIIAAFAGGLSSIATCPFDVVKTRMQTGTVHHYSNLIDGIKTIYKQEGIQTFFQGVGPRIIWIGGGTAITMMVYEYLKQFLRSNESKETN